MFTRPDVSVLVRATPPMLPWRRPRALGVEGAPQRRPGRVLTISQPMLQETASPTPTVADTGCPTTATHPIAPPKLNDVDGRANHATTGYFFAVLAYMRTRQDS
jgi:hypothetical protein